MDSDMKAVVTADIVGSRNIAAKELEARVREVADVLEKALFTGKDTFEFYRGDSFQALLDEPGQALKVALLWRTAMIATNEETPWDIRIAIGIGSIDHQGKTLAVSGGEAFQYSGTLLDNIKKEDGARIAFQTPDEAWNEALNTECLLAEGLISRWSPIGAETVHQQLLYGDTQEGLAARIGISQPAVHKRLQVASWPAIRQWEAHYRRTVMRKYPTTVTNA